MDDDDVGSGEHYLPVHPLPDEIKNLPRNETVCKFCGVSYLIHNEIKLLEDKLHKAENELQHYKGAADRERDAQRRAEALQVDNAQLKQSLEEARTGLEAARARALAAEADCRSASSELDEALERLAVATASRDRLRSHAEAVQKQLPGVAQEIANLRDGLERLRSQWPAAVAAPLQLLARAVGGVAAFASHDLTDKAEMQGRVESLMRQLSLRSAGEEAASAEAKRLRAELEAKTDEARQLSSKAGQSVELLEAHRRAVEELSSLRTRNAILQSELQQSHDQTRTKIEELESAARNIKRKEAALEQQLSLSESQRQQLMSEVGMLREENASLHTLVHDRQSRESEVMSRVTATETQSSVMKEQLERAQADCEALKLEREQMIAAHQRRIEQLRDSFKNKMTQAESWHGKLDDALRQQKEKHQQELQAVKDELHQGFAAEVQIEKQKFHELHEQMMSDLRSENTKLKGQLASAQSASNAEATAASHQLSLLRAAADKNDASQRKEIGSLKGIIKDLEERLARLDDGNRELIMDLTAQLKTAQRDLGDSKQNEATLNKLTCERADEIALLQETVRRECEERLELTEALTEAREQIAQLMKSAAGQNGLPSKPAPGSAAQSPSSNAGAAKAAQPRRQASAEELLLFKHSVQRRTSAKDGSRKDHAASASSVSISYDALSTSDDSTVAAAIRLKEVSATDEQRRRIAAALGKR